VPVTQVTALTAALEKTDHPERARGCAVPWQFGFFHPVRGREVRKTVTARMKELVGARAVKRGLG